MKIFYFILFILISLTIQAQAYVPFKGIQHKKHPKVAIVNAHIQTSPEQLLKEATLLINGNIIQDVGTEIKVPEDFIIIDLEGKYIYPSFVELYSNYGCDTTYQTKRNQLNYWNSSIHPEHNVAQHFKSTKKEAERLRSMGFGTAQGHLQDGISRGVSAVYTLEAGQSDLRLLKSKGMAFYSLNKGQSKMAYPTSLMGSIALLRQSFYDALWYEENMDKGIPKNNSLEAHANQWKQKQCIELGSYKNLGIAIELSKEFKIPFIIKGDGFEYKTINLLKESKTHVISSISYPKKPSLKSSYDISSITVMELKNWENAPYNLSILSENKIPFSISSDKHKKAEDFWTHLKAAHQHGLSEKACLKALTIEPAKLLGLDKKIGEIAPKYLANFLVFDQAFLNKNAKLESHWIQGKPHIISKNESDLSGSYELFFEYQNFIFDVKDSLSKLSASFEYLDKKIPTTIQRSEKEINLRFTLDSVKYLLSGLIDTFQWNGHYLDKNGSWLSWNASKLKSNVIIKNPAAQNIELPEVFLPAYPWITKEHKDSLLIKNACIWTSSKAGVLNEHDLIVHKGKIVKIGKGLKVKKGETIDAKGKFLTAGIIDEHSHIAIRGGVNEAGLPITSMVRIKDVINAEDINIYRQLAGGVTSAQLLHGSANPIGGQSAIIKLKWGLDANKLLFKDPPRFIKFALGENVKQANFHCAPKKRYPKTRMGVEQIMSDAFYRALSYQKSLQKDQQFPKLQIGGISTRKDLALDALVEILNGQRHITCHSYVQSEINMMLKLADSLGFKLNTFTHILEGYKVADKLAEHGAAASTFSDWWAYKYEVKEAIPYNASILHKMNVLTAINSDDAEMGRRLNQEAAKAIKYGNVDPQEAWKMITINPAKMLHIDDKVGSVEIGKDADLVLWTGNPLSIYSKVEKTWIEGVLYFDVEEDEYLQSYLKSEKARLIQKAMTK